MPEETNIKLGLTEVEATARLSQYGPNQIVQVKKFSALVEFLFEFKNPLLIILIAAAIVSGVFDDWASAGIIIAMVVLSVFLDFYNTFKSQKAAEALKEKVRITTTVLREGKEKEIPLSFVVPGDLVQLEPGDIIPADGKVISGKDFFVNESQLTGESFPVEKQTQEDVSMGSNVVAGEALVHIVSTGKNTRFSKIAQTLATPDKETEFDRGIKNFSFLILKLTFGLTIVIFFVNALLKHDILESFLFALALVVGLTPEMLPMIITINLSKGSLIMAKHGVIVKKLSAIQNFGSMDVLCTDKTGTLTEDKISLIKYVDGWGQDCDEAFLYAYIESSFHSGLHNPLDEAVISHKNLDISKFRKADEIPFDYVRRRESIVADEKNDRYLITKGSFDGVVKACSFVRKDGKNLALTPPEVRQLTKEYENLSSQGFRVTGVAVKTLQERKEVYEKDSEFGMVFLGFMAFLDPPKATAKELIPLLERHGIEIKILTGDNEFVTKKIMSDINLPSKGVLLGSDMAVMSDRKLRLVLDKNTVFARVNPEQKQRIIRLLQANGHVVGFMGDGLNDAPSLKSADVSISVANAVDVAKDTADLILMKKSMHQLINGVLEGRKTFANTMKYLMMNLSSNFGNMFSMAFASLYLPFLPMLPIQILLNNFLYDLSQFAIPLDNVDEEDVTKPRKLNINFIKKFMWVFGPVSSIFDFLTFFILYGVFKFVGAKFQTGWFLESIITQTLVVHIIRTRKIPFLQSRSSWELTLSSLLIVGVATVFSLSSVGQWFKFVPLPAIILLLILVIVALYLICVELTKRIFFHYQKT